jgi:Predicted ATPase (AAA+ superfamily)
MYVDELLLYRKSKFQKIIRNVNWIYDNYDNEYYNDDDDKKNLLFETVSDILKTSAEYGLCGNLWHGILTLLIADNENVYSLNSEFKSSHKGSIRNIAEQDFALIKKMFDYDFTKIEKKFNINIISILENYDKKDETGNMFDAEIEEKLHKVSIALSKSLDVKSFADIAENFYAENGVGKFGLHKAFAISKETASSETYIEPITYVEINKLSDIIGYDRQKEKLIANTEAFIQGKAANNVLLFGDSGTGKSSSIKAIMNEYYSKGLRLIEVYKHQFKDLSAVIRQIKDRNYKFIIYMDDLSFEDFELEYKYLKAIIEGGLGERPKNVLIYATSNRRHLIREKFSDKPSLEDDLHIRDTVQEKLSLAARFGVTIYFASPDKREFEKIVRELSNRYNIDMPESELLAEANKWELMHGGLSGRTAVQFISHLLGTYKAKL